MLPYSLLMLLLIFGSGLNHAYRCTFFVHIFRISYQVCHKEAFWVHFLVIYSYYGIRQKEHNTNKKIAHCFLIRNVQHFYGLPLDLYGKRIAAHFDKLAAIFTNALRFGETCPFSREKYHNRGVLQDGTLSGMVSVRCTQKDKCHSGTLVAFFLTYTVYM